MKPNYTSLLLVAGLFFLSVLVNSCAKADHNADLPKEQQVVGTWGINRIQLKIYQGGVFVKDSILKPSPKPKNFVAFDGNGGFEYKFNSTTSDVGSYEFTGSSELSTKSNPKSYTWTMLTLTSQLFTVVSKGTDPGFPGAVVERYQTFTR